MINRFGISCGRDDHTSLSLSTIPYYSLKIALLEISLWKIRSGGDSYLLLFVVKFWHWFRLPHLTGMQLSGGRCWSKFASFFLPFFLSCPSLSQTSSFNAIILWCSPSKAARDSIQCCTWNFLAFFFFLKKIQYLFIGKGEPWTPCSLGYQI